jgi:hypothetical protein
VLAQLDVERTVVDGAVARFDVVSHNLVERRALRPTALVTTRVGRKGLTHTPRLREPRVDAEAAIDAALVAWRTTKTTS